MWGNLDQSFKLKVTSACLISLCHVKSKFQNDRLAWVVVLVLLLEHLLAPQSILSATEPLAEKDIKTVLDPAPFVSARASGLGGALSTISDGAHAPYYNPAGIGGIHWGKEHPPRVRQLHFPYLGLVANEHAQQLKSEFGEGGDNKLVGSAIVDANAGKRQYVRASGLLSVVLGRAIFVQYVDTQFAAFRKTSDELENTISSSYRQQSGTGLGFSVTDASEMLYLGAFTALNNRQSFFGDSSYDELVSNEKRAVVFSPKIDKYSGFSTNVGLIWILGSFLQPTIALVGRDVGGSIYRLKGESSQGAMLTVEEAENLTAGFSLRSRFGRVHSLSYLFEVQDLTDHELALNKKFRAGLELNLWGFGSRATLGFRVGYNLAGLSFGVNANLGLVQFELASHAEDIGIGNRHFVERRSAGVFSVNVLKE